MGEQHGDGRLETCSLLLWRVLLGLRTFFEYHLLLGQFSVHVKLQSWYCPGSLCCDIELVQEIIFLLLHLGRKIRCFKGSHLCCIISLTKAFGGSEFAAWQHLDAV
ncbi:unnamed protein product, partial [Coccothraustes coccothraustes]